MLIETQITPDVNVINFFPAEKVLRSGTAEFVDAKSLRKSPLAEAIFDLGGVRSVFLTSDMISVTKEDNASWDDLKPQILAEIMDFFATGEPGRRRKSGRPQPGKRHSRNYQPDQRPYSSGHSPGRRRHRLQKFRKRCRICRTARQLQGVSLCSGHVERRSGKNSQNLYSRSKIRRKLR